MASTLMLLTGNSSKALATGVVKLLDRAILAPADVGTFSNGETSVSIGMSIRESDVFIIQSGMGDINTNDAVMEMLILSSASVMASAQRVVMVVPYFPYAKQNKIKKRGAVPARLMADMMKVAGASHIITVDLNPAQMAGFFRVPVDNIMVWPLLQQYLGERMEVWGPCVIVPKNAGASKRAIKIAKKLGLEIAMVLSRPGEDDLDYSFCVPTSPGYVSKGSAESIIFSPEPTKDEAEELCDVAEATRLTARGTPSASASSMESNIIGKVSGRCCVLVDDVLDSADAFVDTANALMAAGASKVIVMVTHGVMSGDCPQKIEKSIISEVIVTNTVPQERHQKECSKLKVILCDGVLAEAIRRVHNDECSASIFTSELELA